MVSLKLVSETCSFIMSDITCLGQVNVSLSNGGNTSVSEFIVQLICIFGQAASVFTAPHQKKHVMAALSDVSPINNEII